MERRLEADVVVIGGGITGAAIARELSRYKVETILVEKGGEVGGGQTKMSASNIYTGLNMLGSLRLKSQLLPAGMPVTELYHPDTLKQKWCDQGIEQWKPLVKDLDIHHNYLTTLIMATNKDEVKDLEAYTEMGQMIGGVYADFRWVDREEILAKIEPNVTKEIIAGLYSEGQMMNIFPPEATIALAENAVENGVKVVLNAGVTGVSREDGYQIVHTAKGPVKTNFIVNAAGGHADKIAKMAGPIDWGLQFRKSQVMILDKRCKDLVRGALRLPVRPGEFFFLVIQRSEDNIMTYCGAYDPTDSPDDTRSSREVIIESMKVAQRFVPGISIKDVITSFTGVRVFNTRNLDDHIIEFASTNPRFLNVAIRLPSLGGAAGPMPRHVIGMLADAGLELTTKSDFNPYRKGIPRFCDLSDDERRELIKQDPKYGHVICRCETVTEGEIVEAIKRGARTLEGIQFRTRAGMGRCQRGFCGPRIISILSRELDVPVTEVTKRGEDSPFLLYRSKELLEREGRVT